MHSYVGNLKKVHSCSNKYVEAYIFVPIRGYANISPSTINGTLHDRLEASAKINWFDLGIFSKAECLTILRYRSLGANECAIDLLTIKTSARVAYLRRYDMYRYYEHYEYVRKGMHYVSENDCCTQRCK